MPSFRRATVTALLSERPGLQRVDTDAGRAYVLTALTGPVAVGDPVVVNTTAVELGLGTGGWHVVHWNLGRDEWAEPGPGHIMKLRYTSLQADTGAAEEEHPDLPGDLGGMPVVACTVHSQVAGVAATFAATPPAKRLVYVMTDGAALPLALSDLVAGLRDTGLLAATVTAGHAFGGDLEAVTVPSALALARHVQGADAVVVGMGPGVVGTGTALGTTSVEAAAVLDTAAALGGRPILCVRASSGDQRERHRGVSHHTTTVLDLVRSPVAAPTADDVDVPDVGALLARHGLRVTTMGRTPEQDPLFFQTAGAAGVVAAHQPSP
jgi:hypothetical protein